MDHKGRLQRLRQTLREQRVDTLLVTHLPNVRYLCGFTGSTAILAVSEHDAVFFTDGRYTAQAREEVEGARIVVAPKAPLPVAAEWLSKNERSRRGRRSHVVGIEGEHMPVAASTRLASTLPKAFGVMEIPPLVEQSRMVKDGEEFRRIRNAVLLAARLFDTVLETVRPGVREAEVAAEMEYAARQAGAEGMSFETIIAAGKRSALPHGRASQEPIPEGFVVCDFGVILAGYCSDMTRTLYVGRPSADSRLFYQAVWEAQLAAIDAVKPGVTVGEVDRAARNLLKKSGLARYFTHSTGHGVGLEIHEAPRVAAGQAEVLQPGMVITIEPGAYVPGRWGVRIEDMVVVTERGCEVLTPTTKELITI
ncbi:MAG TPA: Xaa-Pro peptidase family protein [Terriglobales bacterium]|nr:Xaa-Pro peptidase family protein [Terriglobales bacterium]